MKVALMGYARSGKDTFGNLLKHHNVNKTTRNIAFGDELRYKMSELFPDLPTNPKPRRELELFAKACRSIDEDVWVKALARRYGRLLEAGVEDFIITDMRQPNEAKWATQNGFVIVKVESDMRFRSERSTGDTVFSAVNESEKYLHTIYPDWVIRNDGDLEELEMEAVNLLKILEGIKS